MNNLSNAWQMERVKKEFLQEMHRKGKLPDSGITEARDLYTKSYHQTGPRLFPGPGGIDTTLTTMLRDSERHIEAAQLPPKPSSSSRAADAQGGGTLRSESSRQERSRAHKELKARLDSVSQQLQAERHCRKISEEQLIQAQLEKEKEERKLAEQRIAETREQQAKVEPGDIVPYRSSSLANYSSAVGSQWFR
ncbi:hypothetical protein DUNSADRAFT_3320 [Dunaliella salina]|uniref:Uncharacterized protein n=1 Tax=Dunaliella salina TaxID=3046 RepID=A0ABQ7FVI9_DUNSA|nr:hypothetical protein DUNSADRAFT_3320 [Dunaliella salina]|eukprot:KAF5826393.1 hypothetical protein DUNSADRAFT_3320 [Dunaliella salina]